MNGRYYMDARAALIVYAVDNRETFTELDKWISDLDEYGNMPKMVKFLIGNKSDCN